MEVIEQERTTVVVQLPATKADRVLKAMINDVLDGKWCRNNWDTGLGKRCALGLMNSHSGE